MMYHLAPLLVDLPPGMLYCILNSVPIPPTARARAFAEEWCKRVGPALSVMSKGSLSVAPLLVPSTHSEWARPTPLGLSRESLKPLGSRVTLCGQVAFLDNRPLARINSQRAAFFAYGLDVIMRYSRDRIDALNLFLGIFGAGEPPRALAKAYQALALTPQFLSLDDAMTAPTPTNEEEA